MFRVGAEVSWGLRIRGFRFKVKNSGCFGENRAWGLGIAGYQAIELPTDGLGFQAQVIFSRLILVILFLSLRPPA